MNQRVIYLLMVQKLLNLKQRTLKLLPQFCPGNISKDFSVDNMKKTGLNGHVYDFSIEEFNEKFSIIST